MSRPPQAGLEVAAFQQDLFSSHSESLAFDASFAAARRITLDETSWIEVVPEWMSGARVLLERLSVSVPFSQHDRRLFDQTFQEPRLTAGISELHRMPEMSVVAAARTLSEHYGVSFDGLWLNLYRDGNDSTGWHRDWHSCRKLECIVPVLTLGATRRFLIKPRAGGKSIAFKPGSGDLIVMGGRSQQDWVHSVPKDPSVVGPRISINFQSSSQAVR